MIIAVIAACAVAWQMSDDNDDGSSDVSAMANNFADNYTSNFGNFYVEDGATSDSASVLADTGSARMPHSKFTYTVDSDSDEKFAALKTTLENKTTLMGASPAFINDVAGFDGVSIVKYDVVMGTMTKFTMIYFAAYSGNILIDGTNDAFYHGSALATDGEVSKLFKAIADSLTESCIPSYDASAMTKYVDDSYSGGFGNFYVSDGATKSAATAMTDTGSSRLPHSAITYSVTSDASAQYGQIKATLDAKTGIMGAAPTAIENISGFDQFTAYKMDVVMGTMTKFTLIYFVACSGNVLIDGSNQALYFAGSLAEDSDITSIFRTIAMSVYA